MSTIYQKNITKRIEAQIQQGKQKTTQQSEGTVQDNSVTNEKAKQVSAQIHLGQNVD